MATNRDRVNELTDEQLAILIVHYMPKDEKDKAFDLECARRISEVHGYMRGVEE